MFRRRAGHNLSDLPTARIKDMLELELENGGGLGDTTEDEGDGGWVEVFREEGGD
jgi:hypothetical protein